MQVKILDLFSGLGGFSLGLERTGNFKTVAFCEIDKFCTLILQKHWKGVKIYNDVKEIKKERLEADGIPSPDVITGGFPCQPFSVAGKQAGTSDDRHLWPEMFRIIQEFTPRWVVGENVKGITNIQDGMVFETVCTALEGAGYEVRTFNIPAAGVGAPHRRERIWIVANRKESMVNPDNVRLEQHNAAEEETSWWRTSTTFEPTGDVVNTNNDGSLATTQPRSSTQTGNYNEEGQNKASEFKRTSRPNDNEIMENSRRSIRGEQSSRDQESIGPGTSEKTEWSTDSDSITRSSERETIMANANSGRSHEPNNEIQTGRNILSSSSEALSDSEREGLQRSRRQESSRNFYGLEQDTQGNENEIRSESERRSRTSTDVADTESSIGNDHEAVAGNGEFKTQEVSGNGSSVRGESAWWDFEPDVGRVAHGIPGRVHRLKGLGNSIIPKIAQEIGNAIIAAEREEKKKGCPHN